ncbi:hypothetical protein N5H80_003139 [Salmonella enterica]|nr:hypothetical protein [Salmonella enterica]
MESLILNRLASVGQKPVADAIGIDESTISRWKGKGIELLSFRLASGDRYILSTQNGSVTNRKLSRDDLYWSKDTIMEVVREMGSNN